MKNKRGGRKDVTGLQAKILAALADGPRTAASMAEDFSVHPKSVGSVLHRLKMAGRVYFDEDPSGARATLWRLRAEPLTCLLATYWPKSVESRTE